LDAGRRQKKIAGGGGPGEESSSLKQPLLGSSSEQQDTTKQQDTTRQQTYDKEGREAYNNAYQAIEDSYRQKKITFEEFDKATDDLKAAFLQNKNSWADL
jgi:Tfp pilus assembly protein FimT